MRELTRAEIEQVAGGDSQWGSVASGTGTGTDDWSWEGPDDFGWEGPDDWSWE
jgi:hypothetical protein